MPVTSSTRRAERSRRRPLARLARLRPRLVATFAAVAAITAITVAGASFLVVREVRLQGATDEAIAQSRFNFALAGDRLPATATSAEIEALLHALERRGGFDTVVVTETETFQTSVSLGPAVIPADLADATDGGRLAAARRTLAGRPHVVVGGQLGDQTLWFLHPLDDVFDDLRNLGRVLAGAALAAVVISGLVGVAAARPLLRPIRRARDAARDLEAGHLDTRLPESGSDEFAELSHSFNAMAAALQHTVQDLRSAEAGHRRFVADVSHELRTPVTALAAAADVLRPHLEATPPQHRRAIRLLVDEAARLRTLVDDLMEISRLDAGRAEMERGQVDLDHLADAVVREYGWGGDVTITVEGERGVAVTGDRRRLERVITNLIGNALRHGAAPVQVSIRGSDEQVVLDVDDSGAGVPPEHLPHVFDRFYKGDPARQRSSSSGLGLAIARENVLLHDGSIAVGHGPSGGARFRVELPREPVAVPLPAGDEAVTHRSDDGSMQHRPTGARP